MDESLAIVIIGAAFAAGLAVGALLVWGLAL